MDDLNNFIQRCIAGNVEGFNYYGDKGGIQPLVKSSTQQQIGWIFVEEADSRDDEWFGWAYEIPSSLHEQASLEYRK